MWLGLTTDNLKEQLWRMDFFKGHGLGNDYLVMDPKVLTFELTPERIEKICDRNWEWEVMAF